MSDFLANLVGRTLGIVPVVQPRLTSIYAATPLPGSTGPLDASPAAPGEGLEEWDAPRDEQIEHQAQAPTRQPSPRDAAQQRATQSAALVNPTAPRALPARQDAAAANPSPARSNDAEPLAPLPRATAQELQSTSAAEPSMPVQRLRLPDQRPQPSHRSAAEAPTASMATLPPQSANMQGRQLLAPPEVGEPTTAASHFRPVSEVALPAATHSHQGQSHQGQPLYSQSEARPQPPASKPVIHISIGRIDVRAVPPPAPPRQPVPPEAPKLSLNDYLQSFKRESR